MARKSKPYDLFEHMISEARPVSLARIRIEMEKGLDWPLEQQHQNVRVLLRMAYNIDVKSVPEAQREAVQSHVDSIKCLALAYSARSKEAGSGLNGRDARDRASMVNWLSEKYGEVRSAGRRLFEIIEPHEVRSFDICFGKP